MPAAPLESWVPNGGVFGAVRVGDRIVIGGLFTRIGPRTGPAVLLSRASGRPQPGFPEFAGGSVSVVVADGAGGWFVGGSFTWAGGLYRPGLAHVRPDGSVDPSFDPEPADVSPSLTDIGVVRALAFSNGTLYVGGFFNRIGGQSRKSLAAVDVGSGTVTPWDPNPDGFHINALQAGGDRVFVTGDFEKIGGASRPGLAALDAGSGKATTWGPLLEGSVGVLALRGNTLYIGGSFARIGGFPRSSLAALDASSGAVLPWAPDPRARVSAIAPADAVVYVGTSSDDPQDTTSAGVIAFASDAGAGRRWRVQTNGPVDALQLDGETVYVGGSFQKVAGAPRTGLAALDAQSGRALVWDPEADLFENTRDFFNPGAVAALAAGPQGIVAGGEFASVGGVVHRGMAALDAKTGRPLAWDPHVHGGVLGLAHARGRIYFVGSFDRVDGQERNGAAALDSGLRLSNWKILPLEAGNAQNVTVIGRRVILTGSFNGVEPRQGHGSIAAFDAETGRFLHWGPPDLVGNGVGEVFAGLGHVYAVGVSGNASTVALLNSRTGVFERYLFDNRDEGDLYTAALRGRTMYVGGAVVRINGQKVSHLAAVDALTGRLLPWRPSVDARVFAIHAAGDVIYVGGEFREVNGQARHGLAAFAARTGRLLPWNPQPDGSVGRIGALGDGRLYALGDFRAFGPVAQPFAALFRGLG